jgi:hypothetical protein
MAASLGKMPTTSVRRLISPFSRSIGFVLCSLARWAAGTMGGGEAHIGEHVRLGVVHEGREFRQLGAQLIGDLAP